MRFSSLMSVDIATAIGKRCSHLVVITTTTSTTPTHTLRGAAGNSKSNTNIPKTAPSAVAVDEEIDDFILTDMLELSKKPARDPAKQTAAAAENEEEEKEKEEKEKEKEKEEEQRSKDASRDKEEEEEKEEKEEEEEAKAGEKEAEKQKEEENTSASKSLSSKSTRKAAAATQLMRPKTNLLFVGPIFIISFAVNISLAFYKLVDEFVAPVLPKLVNGSPIHKAFLTSRQEQPFLPTSPNDFLKNDDDDERNHNSKEKTPPRQRVHRALQ
ncbi:Merozoite surface protein 9 [Balamuthia mandrillaris]